MRTATTKVRREVYEEFRALCQERGETPYSVLQGFLLAFVEHFGGGGPGQALHGLAHDRLMPGGGG